MRRYTLLIAVAAGFAGAAILQNISGHGFGWPDGFSEWVGRAIGLLVISGIVPCIGWALKKFSRAARSQVLVAWLLIMAVTFYFSLTTARYDQCMALIRDNATCLTGTTEARSSISASASDFLFHPSGCGFAVTFPGEPRTYEMKKSDAQGELMPLKGAELVLNDNVGLLRAECVVSERMDQSQFTESNLTNWSQQIAKDTGLRNFGVTVTKSDCGPSATVVGVKDSERGPLTVSIQNVHGVRSIFTLYKMSLSSNWQPAAMLEFDRTFTCKE